MTDHLPTTPRWQPKLLSRRSWVAVWVFSLVACDLPSDPAPSTEGPRLLASSVDSAGPNEVLLPSNRSITLQFDRALAPSSANRGTVSLQSGGYGVFLSVTVDPVDHLVRLEPDAGALQEGLFYWLTVQNILDASGRPMPVTERRYFRVGPPEATGSTAPTLAELVPLFAQRCGRESCHGGSEATLGLELSSAEGILRTAVGVASRQRPPEGGLASTRSDPRWGPMRRIEAGEPGYSYLLYKLLGEGPRLGLAMPPPGEPPLEPEELRRISAWIRAGALP